MALAFVRRALVLGLLGVVVNAGSLLSQTPDTTFETRAQLVARAKRADSLHLREESFLLHSRLQDGDFEVGDRIVITYSAVALKQTDTTMVVRTGKLLNLPEPLGDVNLNGVLRSELRDSLSARFNTYFKDVVIKVTPLIRLSITGAVRNAGFMYLRKDQPLNDLIMGTGGRDQAADLDNVVIKRGDTVLWGKEDVSAAFADGLSVERLGLTSGDEMVVGFKHTRNWSIIFQGLTAVLSLYVLFRQLKR